MAGPSFGPAPARASGEETVAFTSDTQSGMPPLEMILALSEAVRDSRIEDVFALTDPQVSCQPLVRPGLTVYYGHDGMTRLVHDLHTVHGNYQVAVGRITDDAPTITVQATIMHEAGGPPPQAVTTAYTFRDGLIHSIESWPGTTHDVPQ